MTLPSTLDVFLIRHGRVSGGDRRLAGRAAGVALDAAGRQQAAALARAFRYSGLAAVYCSPRERARETAAAIAQARNIRVETHPSFDEIDFGAWTGRTFEALDADPLWHAFNDHRSTAAIPGGETFAAFAARVLAGCDGVVHAHPSGAIAVVTHAEVIRVVLLNALGWPYDQWPRVTIEPASISIVTIRPESRKVVAANVSAV